MVNIAAKKGKGPTRNMMFITELDCALWSLTVQEDKRREGFATGYATCTEYSQPHPARWDQERSESVDGDVLETLSDDSSSVHCYIQRQSDINGCGAPEVQQ